MTDDLEATRPARRRQQTDTVEATEVIDPRARRSTAHGDVPAPLGRIARAPESSDQVYAVRTDRQPVVSTRAPAVPSAAQQHVDTARAEGDRRRRARVRLTAAVAAASIVFVGAVVTLLVLILPG